MSRYLLLSTGLIERYVEASEPNGRDHQWPFQKCFQWHMRPVAVSYYKEI